MSFMGKNMRNMRIFTMLHVASESVNTKVRVQNSGLGALADPNLIPSQALEDTA